MTGPARIGYLSEIFPDACFIHVIRDPRAVVSSLLKVHFWVTRAGLDTPWWKNGLSQDYMNIWLKEDKSPAVLAALQWKQIIEHAWDELKTVSEKKIRYIEINYEDFVAEPKNVIGKILDASELRLSDKVLRYIEEKIKIRNMNYKFRNNLTTKDIAAVESITRPIAKKIGYTF